MAANPIQVDYAFATHKGCQVEIEDKGAKSPVEITLDIDNLEISGTLTKKHPKGGRTKVEINQDGLSVELSVVKKEDDSKYIHCVISDLPKKVVKVASEEYKSVGTRGLIILKLEKAVKEVWGGGGILPQRLKPRQL